MGIMGAGSAKGKKSWFRRTEGLGGPEALLSMGTGFLLDLPLCQVLVLAVQALPWGSKVGGGGGDGGWGVRFWSQQHGGIGQPHRNYHHSDGMGLNLLLMLLPL